MQSEAKHLFLFHCWTPCFCHAERSEASFPIPLLDLLLLSCRAKRSIFSYSIAGPLAFVLQSEAKHLFLFHCWTPCFCHAERSEASFRNLVTSKRFKVRA